MSRAPAAKMFLALTLMFLGFTVFALARGDGPPQRHAPVPGVGGSYPEEWKTSLAEAQRSAKFPILVPDHPAANRENVTATYIWPEGSAVALQFPAPAQSGVRQAYIEVWLRPWMRGEPTEDFAEDMAAAPSSAKALYYVNEIPALGVSAHSPNDLSGTNPAFLRFVYQGIEVQVSGGDSLGLLLEIARTIAIGGGPIGTS